MEEGIPPDAGGHADRDQGLESSSHAALTSESSETTKQVAQAPDPLPRPPVSASTGVVQTLSRVSPVIPELPARPPERPLQTSTSTSAITAEILSLPWPEARAMLLRTGLWSAPPEEGVDPEFVVGKRVWIDGQVRELCLLHPASTML